VVISTGNDKEKREPLYTVGGNVSFISTAILEKSMEVSQNIKIELPYDQACHLWVCNQNN
jgi:hypothetical protein